MNGACTRVQRRRSRAPGLLALRRIALCLLVPVVAAGCSKSSRFDDATTVDVCALLSMPDIERTFGPLAGPPAPDPHARGFAGTCNWTFQASRRDAPVKLHASLVTRASSGVGMKPSKFFEMSQSEVRVSLGANPWAMKDLGDVAYLYQTRDPAHSELWLRQSETVLIMRVSGGSASQLEEAARLIARELAPRKSGVAA